MLFKLIKKNLSSSDNQHFVVALIGKGTIGPEIEALGTPVVNLNICNYRINRLLFGLRKLVILVRKYNPNIVQGWMYHGNLAALVSARIFRSKASVLWNIRHSLYDLKEEKPITRLIIQIDAKLSSKVYSIIYNSKVSSEQHKAVGFDDRKSMIIPNGFDCEVFRPDQKKRNIMRQKIGIGDDEFIIGHAARYHPIKDHVSFLKAADMIIDRGFVARFVLAGRNVDRENLMLSQVTENIGLRNKVDFVGEQKDMPAFMNALDIFTLSSTSEAFPNVIGEAMACGIPCVATNVGDVAYIIGDTGKVVPPADPEALATAWQEILDMGEQARKALGEKARLRIRNNFSLDEVFVAYEKLYGSYRR